MTDVADAPTQDTVAAVRSFNRFYTRAIGALKRAYLDGPYTLAESRVLFEIAANPGVTPGRIAADLDLDPGYLSRMVSRLERDGLVSRRRSEHDGRSMTLSLTPQGADYHHGASARSAAQVEDMISGLTPQQRARLANALETARGLLDHRGGEPEINLRPHRPGDMGWIVERHALVYGGEYGWGPAIEAMAARICADFLERADPRERCWMAERRGQRLGCVFLLRESEEVARLRLLLLAPAARGRGVGRRLVDECVAYAREAGYREIVLWTHEVLTAARKLYAAAGFTFEGASHEEFSHPQASETWRLAL